MKIKIGVDRGLLRLRWTYKGKRYTLATGMPDNAHSRRYAEAKAVQIERDILHECFDETLNKYRPQSSLSADSGDTISSSGYLTPARLMERFYEYRREVSMTSDNSVWDYEALIRYLENVFGLRYASSITASDVREFIKYVRSQDLADRTKRDRLTRLDSAWQWAIREGLVRHNPFQDCNKAIKLPAKAMKLIPTEAQVGYCIEWVFTNRPQYGPVLAFIAFTGCRPGEAILLLWGDVSKDNTIVSIRSTKTRKTRSFVAPDKVQQIFNGLVRQRNRDNVFLNARGRQFTVRSIRNHGWDEACKSLSMGKYPLYILRAAFVTHCLEHGLPVNFIAGITGHSVEVLMRYYVGMTTEFPEIPNDLYD